MLRLQNVFILVICISNVICYDVTKGTELIMSFLVHRHGDRTPVQSSMFLSTDPEALEALTEPYGYGQLTIAGKRRAYELGKYIRGRYDELLSEKYNRSEIYIRSTDVSRTKMTILTALAAIYPPTGERWNRDIPWEPVPYTTVPLKYDFNTGFGNCPTLASVIEDLTAQPSPVFTEKNSSLLQTLSNELGINITISPAMLFPIYDIFVSQISLGIPLPPQLNEIFGDIEEAAGESIGLTLGLDEYLPLEAGVLLNEFYTYADLAKAGNDTPRLRIYSAHDLNVYALEAVTKVNRQGAPRYASAYSLELRKVTKTGAFVVLPVYLPSPGEEVKYLQVEGCNLLCNYDQFVEITKGYSRDIETWREECGFTEDVEVDESSFE